MESLETALVATGTGYAAWRGCSKSEFRWANVIDVISDFRIGA
jgi:hypothetical protein